MIKPKAAPPTSEAPKKFRPQSRAYMRWEQEDDRPRVRTVEDARLDSLTAEGITVREKLERDKKAAVKPTRAAP